MKCALSLVNFRSLIAINLLLSQIFSKTETLAAFDKTNYIFHQKSTTSKVQVDVFTS